MAVAPMWAYPRGPSPADPLSWRNRGSFLVVHQLEVMHRVIQEGTLSDELARCAALPAPTPSSSKTPHIYR